MQVLSSTKLAKILQKLLIIGRVMMQPGGAAENKSRGVSNSGDRKMTVLEQLLQISNTKGNSTAQWR
jgi:hypothetical protein